MKTLIGLVGYIGCGKTTIAKASGAHLVSFASPIYDALKAIGVPAFMVDNKSEWDIPLDILCGQTIRHAAQTLGTEWGRNQIGEMLWFNLAMNQIKMKLPEQNIIVDNVRFPNEFDALEASGAILIAVRRKSAVPKDERQVHVSERYINILQTRCIVDLYNESDIESAASVINSLLR